MSKVARKAAGARKQITQAISTSNFFKTKINARCASAAPPLGPLLGSFGLNISKFCKDFNEKTQTYKEGIPLPVTVRIKPDRSYDIELGTPNIAYYLKQAAGIEKGLLKEETKSGEITLKHIYEIAVIKHKDPYAEYQLLDLQEVVQQVTNESKCIGLEIVEKIDPEKYQQFLTERKQFIEDVQRKIEEEKKLKLQRG